MKEWFQGLVVEDAPPARLAWQLYAALVILLLVVPAALAQEGPTFVVAAPEMRPGFYQGAVMIAVPLGDGRHVGLVLNKPTSITLGKLYPGHAPSQAVTDPVYIGGPVEPHHLFALVRAEHSPHPSSVNFGPRLWLVHHSDAIDQVIEERPKDARFFIGFVGWKGGELEEEVSKGLMTLRPVDPEKVFLQDTSGLYEQLKRRKGEVST